MRYLLNRKFQRAEESEKIGVAMIFAHETDLFLREMCRFDKENIRNFLTIKTAPRDPKAYLSSVLNTARKKR